MKVLIVEDNIDYQKILSNTFSKRGWHVTLAQNAADCERLLQDNIYDIVFLDWELNSAQNGLDLCRKIYQNNFSQSPHIIMVTGNTDPSFVVKGLRAGADEFIEKPFDLEVLNARIDKIIALKHKEELADQSIITLGPLLLNTHAMEVKFKDKPVHTVTTKEFKILQALLLEPEKIFSRKQLNSIVSGEDVFITSRNIDVHILSLRKKIDPNLFVSVRGVGYKMNPKIIETIPSKVSATN